MDNAKELNEEDEDIIEVVPLKKQKVILDYLDIAIGKKLGKVYQ